jgi:trk system potassium uptake protein TrkA
MKFAVIGLGQFGFQLAVELADQGHEVIAVDKVERTIDSIRDRVGHAVIADATERKSLEQLSLHDLDGVCVTIGEDLAVSLEITGLLQEMGLTHLYCRVISPQHERLLRLMKVENLIQAESLAARQLAKRMGIRGATRHFDLSEEHAIVELKTPERLIGKKLSEVDLRGKYGINLITVKKAADDETAKVMGVPRPDWVFETGDELVVFGKESSIKAFPQRCR